VTAPLPASAGPACLALDIDGVLNSDATLRAARERSEAVSRAIILRHLNPEAMLDALDPAMCERVQRILDATGAGYVLISTWCDLYERPSGDVFGPTYARRCADARDAHVLAIISALAHRGVDATCLGALPEPRLRGMSDYAGAAEHRRKALAAWLDEHPGVTRWCVLDDTTDHYGYRRGGSGAVRYHDPRFIGHCVHPRDGVTDDDAAACVAILGAAPTARNIAPCDDCRAPAGVACGPTCPSRVEPPEAP
jgi:hypothetical protein